MRYDSNVIKSATVNTMLDVHVYLLEQCNVLRPRLHMLEFGIVRQLKCTVYNKTLE